MDWYSNLELLTDLNEKGYFYTTTLKPNAKNFPDKNKIDYSSIRKYAYNNTNNLLIHKYKDKKTIYFATNYEDTTSKIRNIYNFENRGVDKLNQYICYNSLDRKVNKWRKKLFFWGIEVAISNSLILWKLSRDDNYIPEREFKEEICRSLLFQKKEVKKKYINNSISISENNHYPENRKGIYKRCTLCQINGTRKECNFSCKISKIRKEIVYFFVWIVFRNIMKNMFINMIIK